jgi:hypothetical protein
MERKMRRIDPKIEADNRKVFALLSVYLNRFPDYVKKEEIDQIVQCGVSMEYAFGLLLSAAFGLDVVDRADDKDLFERYFLKMCHQLDAHKYSNNPFYQAIRFSTIKKNACELRYASYQPFEGFVCDDIIQTPEGRQIPQIGFFDTEFPYPVIQENDRIWMTITPNEIETMQTAIERASGRVLTYGLGIGYYAYMVSEKASVSSVTIIENNADIIDLFCQHLLPQFKNSKKIRIVHADAFNYAQKDMHGGNFDFVFTDLWHDVSDGVEMYEKMRQYEPQNPGLTFMYWIEKSIQCYL